MSCEWNFTDSQNTPVITIKRILHDKGTILYVTHDLDDGSWQFLDGKPVDSSDAIVVSLSTIVNYDVSVVKLADLPLGWYAWRSNGDSPWQRKAKRSK
jgi:hypothetical protein